MRRDVETGSGTGQGDANSSAVHGLRIDSLASTARSPRVGLLEGRTGTPVFLLYLEGLSLPLRTELHSARDVETFLSTAATKNDRAAWESVLPFFTAEGSRALVHAQPLTLDRATILPQMIGADRGLSHRTGLFALRNFREVADVVVIPQVSLRLGAEQHSIFLRTAFDHLAEDPHFFLLCDFPQNFRREDVAQALRGTICSDAAVFYPWLLAGDQPVQPGAVVAAAIQRCDEQRGIHCLPANQPLRGGFRPLLRHTPGQLSELVEGRVNVFHEFPSLGTRLWGGATLADRFDTDSRFLSTRRTMMAIREAVHRVCEPFVLEPLYPGIDKSVDVALHSAFEPLRRFFHADSKNPFETDVRIERQHGQDVLQVDIRCSVPFALGELKFTLGMAA